MPSLNFEDFLTIVHVIVDDWYQRKGHKLLTEKVGKKPEFSDSEVIALMRVMDLIPFPSEREFLAFISANYRALFPKLLDQSQFNRRARGYFAWSKPAPRIGGSVVRL